MSALSLFEQFTLTPCHPLRLAASSNLFSLLGLLEPTDAQSFACSESTGIKLIDQQVASLRSEKNLDGLREHLSGQNEWSLSTWITATLPPSDELPMLQPILVFGSGTVSRQVQSDAGCGGYYMMVAQFGGHLVFGFEDATQHCRMIRMSMFEVQQDVPVSLTITTSGSTTNLYIQGEAVMENIASAADLTRLPVNQTLQLFPLVDATDSTTKRFQGSITQVSFFGETLSSEQAHDIFEQGIGEAAVVPLYLEAHVSDAVVIEQDTLISEPTLIWIGGSNTSTATLPLFVDIQGLPTKGDLFTAGAKLLAGVNSIPIPVNSTGLWIEYRRPSGDYFTVPTMNAYGETLELPIESFQYRVIAQYEQRLLAASEPVTQTVQIQNVNHAPTWINSNEAAVTVTSDVPSYNFSLNILMDEADFNLNRVRVDLTVHQGRISLRNETLADFDFCNTRSYSAWQCTHDGQNKKRISFVAVPSDVAEILASLSYEGLVPGDEDTLVMDVFDGVGGGQCLDEREHQAWKNTLSAESSSQYSSLSRECYHVQSMIKIPSTDISGGNKSGGSSWLSYMNLDFKNFGSADIVFWVLFVVICYCLFHCFRSCFPNCLARGTRVNADNKGSKDQAKVAGEATIQAEIKVDEASQQPVADDIV